MRALLLVVCLSVYAQPWSGIIDPSRAIDWSFAGIPGGIPNRVTICASLNSASYGNGSSDATSAIQNALNSCPSTQVVLLSTGRFRINTSIQIPSNVTLRGSGARNTILDVHGTGNAVNFGAGATPNYGGQTTDITSGSAQGSQSITLSSASGVVVGGYLTITQLNDTYVTNVGEGGQVCSWCDPFNGTRLEGQIVEVTQVNGTTVQFSPPLFRAYSRTPKATSWSAGAKYAGLENLQVYANNTGYLASEMMEGAAYCWIKGVTNNFADGDHARAISSFRGEIRDSYFAGAFLHEAGGTDSDLFLATYTTGFLVENNILERLHTSIMLNWGAAGNVVAYNYTIGAYASVATNFSTSDISMHAAHPSFNLFEGNAGANFTADSTWGSSSHNTLFRNWWKGTTLIANPITGRGTIDWAGAWWSVQKVRGIELNFAQRYFNLVGNVVGSAETAALKAYNVGATLGQQTMVIARANRSYDSIAYGYTFGYSGATDTGSATESNDQPYVTSILHGEYEYTANAVIWDPGISARTLPASLYRSSRPTWFSATPWPAIGPDVTGGNVSSVRGYANKIPAQVCYEATGATNGIKDFDADACYQATASTYTGGIAGTVTISGKASIK